MKNKSDVEILDQTFVSFEMFSNLRYIPNDSLRLSRHRHSLCFKKQLFSLSFLAKIWVSKFYFIVNNNLSCYLRTKIFKDNSTMDKTEAQIVSYGTLYLSIFHLIKVSPASEGLSLFYLILFYLSLLRCGYQG